MVHAGTSTFKQVDCHSEIRVVEWERAKVREDEGWVSDVVRDI